MTHCAGSNSGLRFVESALSQLVSPHHALPKNGEGKPRLLLFFASVDPPQRDAACATLAWLAAAEGSLFECYYDSPHTGVHFGGGHPSSFGLANLLGGTVTGGGHPAGLSLPPQSFDCEAVFLGPTLFDGPLEDSRVPVWSRAAD